MTSSWHKYYKKAYFRHTHKHPHLESVRPWTTAQTEDALVALEAISEDDSTEAEAHRAPLAPHRTLKQPSEAGKATIQSYNLQEGARIILRMPAGDTQHLSTGRLPSEGLAGVAGEAVESLQRSSPQISLP